MSERIKRNECHWLNEWVMNDPDDNRSRKGQAMWIGSGVNIWWKLKQRIWWRGMVLDLLILIQLNPWYEWSIFLYLLSHSLQFSSPLSMFFKVFPLSILEVVLRRTGKSNYRRLKHTQFQVDSRTLYTLPPWCSSFFLPIQLVTQIAHREHSVNWHTRHALICTWNEKSRFGKLRSRNHRKEKQREGERETWRRGESVILFCDKCNHFIRPPTHALLIFSSLFGNHFSSERIERSRFWWGKTGKKKDRVRQGKGRRFLPKVGGKRKNLGWKLYDHFMTQRI